MSNKPRQLILSVGGGGTRIFVKISKDTPSFERIDKAEEALNGSIPVLSFSEQYDRRHTFAGGKATRRSSKSYFFTQFGEDSRFLLSKRYPRVAYGTSLNYLSEFPKSIVPAWLVLDEAVNWSDEILRAKIYEREVLPEEYRTVFYIKIANEQRVNNNVVIMFGLKGLENGGEATPFKTALNISNIEPILRNYAKENGLNGMKVVELDQNVLFNSAIYPVFEPRNLVMGVEPRKIMAAANGVLLLATLGAAAFGVSLNAGESGLKTEKSKIESQTQASIGERSTLISENAHAFARGMSVDYGKGFKFAQALHSDYPHLPSYPVEMALKEDGSEITTRAFAYDENFKQAKVLLPRGEVLNLVKRNLEGEGLDGLRLASINISDSGVDYEIKYTFESIDGDFRNNVAGN